MDEKLIKNLKSESRWLRLVFMVLFGVVGYLAGLLAVWIGIIQAIHGFIMNEPNKRLLAFSASLNQFIYQVVGFITYNSDVKPYPFSDWPGAKTDKEQA